MVLKFPTRYQTCDWNCGPTCLDMIGNYFFGHNLVISHTNYMDGMGLDDIVEHFEHNELDCEVVSKFSKKFIKKEIDLKNPVIIAVECPYQKIPHYAVIYGYEKEGVHIANYYREDDEILSWKDLKKAYLDEMIVCWEI
jgi:ABC-type bacteriocin/lantibiotic exporter with double-glycine peptidase domain